MKINKMLNINTRKRKRDQNEKDDKLEQKIVKRKKLTNEDNIECNIEDENHEDEEEDEDEEYEDEEDEEDEEEMLKETNPEAYANLLAVRKEIARTEPNIKELLLTPMRIEDRAKLFQYYEIYKMTMPNTELWMDCRIRYNEMFKDYKSGYEQSGKYSKNDISRMKKEEEKFTVIDAQLAMKYKILNLKTSKENKEVIFRRYEEFISLGTTSDEFGKLKHWLTWATDFPHDRVKKIKVKNITKFIKRAKETLDKELYGMEKVKEQILLFLTAKLHNPNMIHTNLGLVGPPGCGKTAISRIIAEIMDWGFSQISFGGMDKADFLKGHEYTYVGAQPGEIVKCLKRMGHKNGIIFLDELDKISENPEIRSALLHMIDPTQNKDYHDNFLGGEISIDLSKIWYIGSMNFVPSDEALADRWWIIKVDGYKLDEKIKIVENYLIPKAIKNCGMVKNSVTLCPGVANNLINKVCNHNDKGVRTLEKIIKDLINKINFIITHQDKNGVLPFKTSFELKHKLKIPVVITNEVLDKLLINKEEKDNSVLKMLYI